MLIDSHAHLSHEYLKSSLDEIIKESKINNIGYIISIGCSIIEAKDSIVIAEKYSSVFATVGLYPRDSKEEPDLTISEKLKIIKDLASHPKVVAIGECGLDFSATGDYEIESSEKEQTDRFIKQIKLAKELEKPLIIHSRNAVEQTLKVFSSTAIDQKAVWHCFSENISIANKALESGLYLSFTGNITYPKNTDLRATVKMVPLDKIMIETDAPYLTPQKARDLGVKRNAPQYVKMIAEEIAEIKGISIDEVEKITTQNTLEFFGLKS